MSVLEEIAKAIYTNRPAMLRQIRMQLCKHEDSLKDDDGRIIECHDCHLCEQGQLDAMDDHRVD